MANVKDFKAQRYLQLSASIAAGTVSGKPSTKQRVPFALRDPRGSKHDFYKRMNTNTAPTIDGKTRPTLKVFTGVVKDGIRESQVYDPVPVDVYKTALADRMEEKMSTSAFQQASASVFSRITFPEDVVTIMSIDNEDGFLTGSYQIFSGSNPTSTAQYSAIANNHGYVDWRFANSSSFNTGATWSFLNSSDSTGVGGANGNEFHQSDATASFAIRTYASGSATGSFIANISGASFIPNGNFSIPQPTSTHGSVNLIRVDNGNLRFYEYNVPSSSGVGPFVSQSTAAYNSTIITAKIFGDGDEDDFITQFNNIEVTNSLYSAGRELITFPYDTVVASGSFFHSNSFPTLVGVTGVGQTGYSPNRQVTLYWASGSSGVSAGSLFGISGSISPSALIPDSDSIKGAQSGSHLFLNSALTMPASGGYYTVGLANYPSTLSDGHLQGGVNFSGSIHVAGDGMRGNTTTGEDYFLNPFRDSYAISESVITAAPRWNGFSFSRIAASVTVDKTGYVFPGLQYITGSAGD